MIPVAADEVRQTILDLFEEEFRANGLTPDKIPDDFDLLTEGIIDSMGVMSMIAAVEDQVEAEIDFEDLDDDDLTVIGPFSRFVESISNKTGAQPAEG